jgi:excisionase family DNA binding protein
LDISFVSNISPIAVSVIAFRAISDHIPTRDRLAVPKWEWKEMNALLDKPDTVVPSERDAEQATQSSRVLAKARHEDGLRVKLEDTGEEFTLPKAAVQLLNRLLTEMSNGNAVTVIPIHAELTTQEAADFLNVSRPHLVSLLTAGKLAYRKVGTHRRIKFLDLQAYKAKSEKERGSALDELAKQAQELNMGY